MSDELVKLLSNELSMRILSALLGSPLSPRRLSEMLGVDESLVSRRLKQLEKHGIVEGRWERVEGKNMKIYRLKASGVELRFTPVGLEARVKRSSETELPSSSPPEYPFFVGRRKETARLMELSPGLVFIVGIAGIGKTALAAEYARASGKPVAWISMSPSTTILHVAWRAARPLAETGRPRLAAALRSGALDYQIVRDELLEALKEEDLLLVLDDYHSVYDGSVKQLVKEIARLDSMRSTVLVLSREKPDFYVPFNRVLELRPLTEEDSLELLEALGVPGEEARHAYELIGGHPYMLVAYAQLAKSGKHIEAGSVKYFLAVEILESLREDEREVLEVLSVFGEPIPLRVLEWMGLEYKRSRMALRSMEQKMLVVRAGRSYGVHELLKDVCYQSIEDPRPLHRRAAEYYASQKNELAALEAINHYIASGDYELAASMTKRLMASSLQARIASMDSYVKTLEFLLRRVKTRSSRAWLLLSLASAYLVDGRVEEASSMLDESLLLARSFRDQELEARSLVYKAISLRMSGRYGEAASLLDHAYRIASRHRGLRLVAGQALYTLASIRYFEGEADEAIKLLEKAMVMLPARNLHSRAVALGWLGMAYRLKLELGESEKALRESLELFKASGGRHSVAVAYKELALTQMAAWSLKEARENLEKAASLCSSPGFQTLLSGIMVDYSIVLSLQRDSAALRALAKVERLVGEHNTIRLVAEALAEHVFGDRGKAREKALAALPPAHSLSAFRKAQALAILAGILEDESLLREAAKPLAKPAGEQKARDFVYRLASRV